MADKTEAEREAQVKADQEALLKANPVLYGMDVNDPEFKGPNGISLISVGPILPKAAGEMKNVFEGDQLVERAIDEDDAKVREGVGVIILPVTEDGRPRESGEELRARGEKAWKEQATKAPAKATAKPAQPAPPHRENERRER